MAALSLPPWLADEAQIRSLLHAVLDRFDQQGGESRRQRLYFPAEKNLPALKRVDDEADQLWRLVRELERLQLLRIKEGKRDPLDADWKGARLGFSPDAEATLRAWLDRPGGEPALPQWRATVARYVRHFPNGIEPLLRRRITIPGFDDDGVVQAFAGLGSIATPHTLRQLSARLFAGDSKQLDSREDIVLALFPDLPLRPRPLIVSAHLPRAFHGVLFIENQDTYALALEGGLAKARDLALIYAAGFRGGAQRIRDRAAARLHYHADSSESERFESWWFDITSQPPGPLYFFGDLDFSGMAILASLRQRFGEVSAWREGYDVLLDRLDGGYGHTPNAADKQLQPDPGLTGCPYADEVLLPAARKYGFIDQEAFVDVT